MADESAGTIARRHRAITRADRRPPIRGILDTGSGVIADDRHSITRARKR